MNHDQCRSALGTAHISENTDVIVLHPGATETVTVQEERPARDTSGINDASPHQAPVMQRRTPSEDRQTEMISEDSYMMAAQ
jgi:hypothetical protein